MSGVFQKWMKDWEIKHRPSSAYFPRSNNRAETAVIQEDAPRLCVAGRKHRQPQVCEGHPTIQKHATPGLQELSGADGFWKKIVIKVDGSRRLTLRNRRFIRKLDPGKASLRNPMPGRRRTRYYDETPPLWSPPPPVTITPPQLMPSETTDDLTKNTETPTAEVSLPSHHDGGADQHLHGDEDQLCDVTVASILSGYL